MTYKTVLPVLILISLGLAFAVDWGSQPEPASSQSGAVERPSAPEPPQAEADAAAQQRRSIPSPQPEPGPAPEFWTYRVLDDEGRPVSGALVQRWNEALELSRAHSDAAGRLELRAEPQGRGLLVTHAAHPPLLLELSGAADETELRLPTGQTLRAVVTVDGQPPTEAIEFELRPAGVPATVPAALRDWLEDLGQVDWPRRLRVAAHSGRLAPVLLPRPFAGELRLRSHGGETGCFVFATPEGQTEQLALREPATQQRIALVTRPCIRAQLLWEDNRQPVTEGAVAVSYDEGGGMGASIESPDGRIYLRHLPHRAGEKFELSVDNPAAAESVHARGEGPSDLGILWMKRASGALHFLVEDQEGRPLSGARVYGAKVSMPSDAEGRGLVLVRERGRPLTIAAPGYRVLSSRINASGSAADPLRFRLQKGNRLRITLRDPDGKAATGTRLQLICPTPIFDRPGFRHPHFKLCVDRHWTNFSLCFADPDLSRIQRSRGWNPMVGLLAPTNTDSASYVLGNLVPGESFAVAAVDLAGRELGRLELRGPAFGAPEQRVTLRLRQALLRPRLRLVDHRGQAVPNAAVSLGEGLSAVERRGDGRGEVLLGGLAAGSLDMAVLHPDFAWRRAQLVLRAGMGPALIELQPGRRLRVRVEDASGKGLDCENEHSLRLIDLPLEARSLKLGVYEFWSVPRERVAVELELSSGKKLHQQVDAGTSTCRLVLQN